MQRLLDALKDQVLPRVQNGVSRVVPFLVHAENSGIEKFSEAYCYDTQRHGYFEFFWLLNGVATMKINGLLYTLAPGDFCFLPPLLQHADVYDASTPAYESLWFGCWPETVSSHLFSYQPVGNWEVVTYCMAAATPEIWRVLDALQGEFTGEDEARELAVRGLLLQLGVLLLRVLSAAGAGEGSAFYVGSVSRRTLKFLRENYARDLALHDIAHVVGLSPHYLASVFKKETGQTIFHALTEIRLNHAKRLIAEERIPIREVAAQVGFSSPHHFSRVFRRLEGVPPSHFQK